MVRLDVSSAGETPATHLLRQFPCVVGRGSDCGLRVAASGVWERHAEIDLKGDAGFAVRAVGDGVVVLNGVAVKDARIRNGDQIEMGGLKIRFWLAPVRARPHRGGDIVFWGLCALAVLGMLTLIFTQPR